MADAIKSTTPPPALPRKMNPFVITAVVALVAVAAGYAIGVSRQSATPPPAGVDKSQNTYAAGYEAAKQKLVELGLARPTDMAINNISGKIKAVGATSVTVEAELPMSNPLDEKRVVSMVVKIDEATKISRQLDFNSAAVQKEQQRFNEEMMAFQKAMADGKEATPPTSPSMTEKIVLSEIKVGAMVMIMALDDMSKVSEVLGSEIQLLPTPPEPPPMPLAEEPTPPPMEEPAP